MEVSGRRTARETGEFVVISVIVCTLNRAEQLRRCIDAFRKVETKRPWELIVVDNGSTDGTAEFLKSQKHLTYVREERRGLPKAQNAGLRVAGGDIVSFTDDDCYVTPNYIEALRSAFDYNPHVDFVSGRILLFDPEDKPITINTGTEPKVYPAYSYMPPGEVQGCNMAFRRSAIDRVGGFDEYLPSAADVGIVADVLQSGGAGIFDPNIVIYHHHGRKTQKQYHDLMVRYDIGRGAYYAKGLLQSNYRKAYMKGWMETSKASINAPWYSRKKAFALFIRATVRELYGGILYLIGLAR